MARKSNHFNRPQHGYHDHEHGLILRAGELNE